MPHTQSITERIFRRLLREAGTLGGGLGVAVFRERHGFSSAVLYDPSTLAGDITSLDPGGWDGRRELFTSTVIKGFVRIHTPSPGTGCGDASTVTNIAGPGVLLYQLAFALSPNGIITPDREEVSTSARRSLKGIVGNLKTARPGDPPTPGTKIPFDDPDCINHGDPDLDAAYVAQGNEVNILNGLAAVHDDFVSTLDPGQRKVLEKSLLDFSWFFFMNKKIEKN
jgi:hypothetical protein